MSLMESQPKAKGSFPKSPPRDVVHDIQSYESFFVNTKIKSCVIAEIIFLRNGSGLNLWKRCGKVGSNCQLIFELWLTFVPIQGDRGSFEDVSGCTIETL